MIAVRIETLGKAYRLGETNRKALIQAIRNRLSGTEEKLFWALKDISVDVHQGEVVGILGHNGAGKSTLLKILSHITTPTCGRVRLNGRVASLLEVGTGFHLELTGRENVFLNGAILGMSRREVAAKFDEIVAFARVDDFIDTPVKRYSTGMRVRLAFAVAAHLEPEILVIDEVLAVGDAAFQQKCTGKLGEVAGSGRTVLFVSHNAAAVESLCRRGIVLDHGRMVFDGTQTEALKDYAKRIGASTGVLRDRKDRTGTGEVRIVGLEFRDANGAPSPAVRTGEDVEVWMHYESHDGSPIPQLICDVTLTTGLGSPLVSQSNSFSDERLENLPGAGAVVCRLPAIPLVEGTYRCNIGLYPVFRKRSAYDELINAGELQIIQSDFFGGGKTPRTAAGDGPFLVRGTWRPETGVSPHAS